MSGFDTVVCVLSAAHDAMHAPEVIVEDDGDLCMDWLEHPRTLSISVSSEGRIGWAALIHGQPSHGSCWYEPDAALREIFSQWATA